MPETREETIKLIIDEEQDMFCALNTEDNQNSEDQIKPFRLGRWMTFSALSEKFLDAYYKDLSQATMDGRNLLMEKYALMENKIANINDSPLVWEIVNIESGWMHELSKKYPKTIQHTDENSKYFKKYTACELQTYSNSTLECLYVDVKNALQKGINLAEERYNNFYQLLGYGTLEDLENTGGAGNS